MAEAVFAGGTAWPDTSCSPFELMYTIGNDGVQHFEWPGAPHSAALCAYTL